MSGHKDCHEFRFSIVRIVVSVSNVTSMLLMSLAKWQNNSKLSQIFRYCHKLPKLSKLLEIRKVLLVRSSITLIKCIKSHTYLGSTFIRLFSAGGGGVWNKLDSILPCRMKFFWIDLLKRSNYSKELGGSKKRRTF